jgi:spore germination protein GerM
MKKFLAILLIFALSISIVACKSNKETPVNEDPIIEEPINEPNEDEGNEDEPESIEVTLYFANEDYIETGDESLEILIPERREIETREDKLGEAIVRALMEGTESEKAQTAIPSTSTLNGVEIIDGTAFVDFARDGMYGGSLQEGLTINQIVASLIELDSVDSVQFLIDGEIEESLMGHYIINKPLTAIE